MKSLKKIICALGIGTCILGTSISAYAIGFDVTPPGDPYSYAVKKEDTEQRAYVTGTYFSKYGTLYTYSQQCENSNVRSNTMAITSSSPSKNAAYKKYARPNLEYEMYSYASVNGLNVLGRYTP